MNNGAVFVVNEIPNSRDFIMLNIITGIHVVHHFCSTASSIVVVIVTITIAITIAIPMTITIIATTKTTTTTTTIPINSHFHIIINIFPIGNLNTQVNVFSRQVYRGTAIVNRLHTHNIPHRATETQALFTSFAQICKIVVNCTFRGTSGGGFVFIMKP